MVKGFGTTAIPNKWAAFVNQLVERDDDRGKILDEPVVVSQAQEILELDGVSQFCTAVTLMDFVATPWVLTT